MIFGLPRKLGGVSRPLKMHPKGCVIVAPLETFREIERGHLLATGITCLCIYIHDYVSLKKELERQDHGGYVPREMRNCGTFREFREIESMYL